MSDARPECNERAPAQPPQGGSDSPEHCDIITHLAARILSPGPNGANPSQSPFIIEANEGKVVEGWLSGLQSAVDVLDEPSPVGLPSDIIHVRKQVSEESKPAVESLEGLLSGDGSLSAQKQALIKVLDAHFLIANDIMRSRTCGSSRSMMIPKLASSRGGIIASEALQAQKRMTRIRRIRI
jgi:hypothetical protein